jgi:aryl-phospho-beta-D-glucosidase BglC (GH1 family)
MPDAGPPPTFVHVNRKDFVDGDDKTLMLRSVALGNWLEPEGYMWKFNSPNGDRPRRIEDRVRELLGDADAAAFWKSYRDRYTTEEDIARVAELGFNSVRVAMNARLLLPEGQDQFDESQFVYLKKLVEWGAKHKVYVIFDMHCAPGGETGKNIDDSPNDQPELFQKPENQDRLVKLWIEIATRFANDPWVLGYDLLNEPLPEADFSQYTSQLYPLYQRVGKEIRKVDPNHTLIVEGANWANDWSTLGDPFDDNMAYSFHKYWNGNDQGAIQGYLDKRDQWNRPVWVGETGENDNAWYSANFDLLENNNVSWCFWPWKKLDTGNTPYSVPSPGGWGAIVSYVDSGGAKPDHDTAKATFDALLENITLSKSSYNGDVICSLGPAIRKANNCQ